MTNHSSLPFYVTGGTLHRDAPSYVLRQADATLYDDLMQSRFCYVLTSHQMGKSSLMVRTAARLREEGVGVVVLDLTALGSNVNAEQWYGGLIGKLGEQLELEDELIEFWQAQMHLGPLQRWMRAIRQVVLPRYVGRVVIFVDEIDAVRSLPFSTDEFFAGIREFYNARTEDEELERLTFCLLGVATPSDLIRDTRTTPFNIGQRIELHDFTDEEAAPLAQGLRQTPEMGAALLKRILYWTGGHPYLTQRLCQAVAAANPQSASRNPQSVDRLCQELFLSEQAQERDDNLLFVRERMLRSEVDLAGLLGLYAQVRRGKRVRNDVTNPSISILRLSGVTRVDEGYLRVMNRIYERVFDREWAKENMPDAELRRQREAYRRGLLRAAAVAAVIVAMIAGLAFLAIQQRNFAKAEAGRADRGFQQASLSAEEARKALTEAERQREEAVSQQMIAEEQRRRVEQQEQANRWLLYTAQMNVAQQDWETANIGRMEKLLADHLPKPGQEDFRGFEWYYLWRLSHRELFTWRHADEVYSGAFSPDGRKLATSGGAGHSAKLWDVATGRELMTFKGHASGIRSLAFSPDGRRLATASADRTVKLWDAATGQEIVTLKGHSATVWVVTFSPDGKRLATGSNNGIIKLWDVATGQELPILIRHRAWVPTVTFSPDGKSLASGSGDRTVKLWDAATGKELATFRGHTDNVLSLAFSPDGKRLVSASFDHTVKLWDVSTGKELATIRGHKAGVWSVAFSPDGKRFATGSDDRMVKLWDAATGQELGVIKGHGDRGVSVVFSPDAKKLATSSLDGATKLWEVAVTQELTTIKGHTDRIMAVVFSPNGKRLASGSVDRTVRLWDVATGRELATLRGHASEIRSVAFSPDGKRLASSSVDRTVRLWDAATGQELATLRGHTNVVLSIAFTPDGKRLATGSVDNSVRLWDVAKGSELANLKGHTSPVHSVALAPDGKTLASGGEDRTIKLWDSTTGRRLGTLEGHTHTVWSVAFSPDGHRIASGSQDRTIKLWDVATRREIGAFVGHGSMINAVTFSPDGKRLVSCSDDHTVRLWDVATTQELLSLTGHAEWVMSVAFSPDGKTLATGGWDHNVKLWRAASDKDVSASLLARHQEMARKEKPQTRPQETGKKEEPRSKAGSTAQLPTGWFAAGTDPRGYDMELDRTVSHSGKTSGRIKWNDSGAAGFGSMAQAIKADDYRGARVRLSGYVKVDRVEDYACLWLRVDGELGEMMGLDNMSDRMIWSTLDWKRYELVLDVPENSSIIYFGIILKGAGQAWVDDLKLEVVGRDIPTTNLLPEQPPGPGKETDEYKRRKEAQANRVKNLPSKPVNLDFEGQNQSLFPRSLSLKGCFNPFSACSRVS